MRRKINLLFFGVICSILSACVSKPAWSVKLYASPTPYVLIPEFSAVAPNDPVIPIPAGSSPLPPATPVSAFTLAPSASQPDFSPILYGEKYDVNGFFLLLGGVQAGKWLTPEQAAPLIHRIDEYDIRTSSLEMFQVLGYAPESTPTRPGQYTIRSDTTHDGFGMLGVVHGWPVRQGRMEELSPDNETYKQIVLDWLKDSGVPDPQLGDFRIYRVDLEDDGVDEIFISATHLDDSQHTTRQGDFSIILMHKVIRNQAITVPIVVDLYHSEEAEITFPRTYLLAGFMDLNQDHILEVVVDYQRWEEDGAMIYTIHDLEVTQIP